MKIILTEMDAILCRTVGEETRDKFDSLEESVANAKARLAVWRRGGDKVTRGRLRSCEFPIVGTKRVAVQIDEMGTFIIKADEDVVADIYLVARITAPRAVEIVGWTTREAFTAGAKRTRGRGGPRSYKVASKAEELFGAPVTIDTLEQYSALSLREFATRDDGLLVRSEIVPEPFWLVSNEGAARHATLGAVVYTAEEALHILELAIGDDGLRLIHNFKRVYGGTLVGIRKG